MAEILKFRSMPCSQSSDREQPTERTNTDSAFPDGRRDLVERQARLKRVKKLARMAFDMLRSENICGVLKIEGEEKHLRKFNERELGGELLNPFRANAGLEEF